MKEMSGMMKAKIGKVVMNKKKMMANADGKGKMMGKLKKMSKKSKY